MISGKAKATAHGRGQQHGTLDLELIEKRGQPAFRQLLAGRRLPEARQVDGKGPIPGSRQGIERADLLPGGRREAGTVEQNYGLAALRPSDQVMCLVVADLRPLRVDLVSAHSMILLDRDKGMLELQLADTDRLMLTIAGRVCKDVAVAIHMLRQLLKAREDPAYEIVYLCGVGEIEQMTAIRHNDV